MRSSLARSLVLLLLPAAATLPPAAAAGVVGRATLQVRAEPGYDAPSLGQILRDDGYLGSVVPGMVSVAQFQGEPVEGVTVLDARALGNEILTLSLKGSDEATVRGHLTDLLQNLTSLVPSRRADALLAVEAATKGVEAATSEHERMRGRLTAFVQEHGAVEPTQWLQTIRQLLQTRSEELERLELDVASTKALRDYLAATIEKMPREVETASTSPDLLRQAQDEFSALQVQLNLQSETQTPTSPAWRKAKEQLEDARKRLEALRAERSLAPNPRRAPLEAELFDVERDLARSESRRLGLRASVAELRDEAKRLALVEAEWRDLREQVELAENGLFQARAKLDQAQAQARQALTSDWAVIVAGPTFSAR